MKNKSILKHLIKPLILIVIFAFFTVSAAADNPTAKPPVNLLTSVISCVLLIAVIILSLLLYNCHKKDASIKAIKDRLRLIINTAPVAYLMSVNGKIVEANEFTERHLGIRAGDSSISIYEKPELRQILLDHAKSNEFVENQIIKFRLAGGGIHRFLVNVSLTEFQGETAYILWGMDIEGEERQKDSLNSARQSMQNLLDSMPVPVRLVDVETSTIIYANNALLKMFGYDTQSEILGAHILDLLPEAQSSGELSQEKLEKLLCAKEPVGMNLEYLTRSKEMLEAKVTVCPIEYDNRQALIGIVMDISHIKEIKRASQSLQTILDTMPMAIRIVNISDNKLTYANQAALEMFNCESYEDIANRSILDFMPETQPNGVKTADMIANMAMFERHTDEFQCLTINKEPFFARITKCNIDYKGNPSSLAILENLTSEREFQRLLLSTAEKEKVANEQKSRFLVNMSHEIRTPMNVIIGLTDIELRKTLSGETMEIYKKINNSAKTLLNIVNDILDLSKIEADKIELYDEEFRLDEVINNALLVASPRLEGKNVEFLLDISLELPCYLIGDKTRLWQVIKNFLDNSAKYTDKGRILLKLFADKKLSDEKTIYITFIVRDTGIGMNESQLQRIFMPYSQIYSEAQKRYTGTGLGLVISKQLCEIMGGKIKIESNEGIGTTVSFTIPFVRSDKPDTQLQSAKIAELEGVNVLLVDDDHIYLNIVSMLLDNCGANCVTAQNGEAAVNTIKEHYDGGGRFDIILLDYMMDGLDGVQTAREIQKILPEPPKMLMVTAKRNLTRQEVRKNGIDDLIEKPFIPSNLLDKICSVLKNKKATVSIGSFPQFKDARILISEDYDLNQEVIAGMLSSFGITPEFANNGKECVDLLQNGQRYDLIFMDLQMPVMDGYEATEIIRSDMKFDDIPIISLTADAMKDVVQKCLEMGFNDHMSKPVEFKSLEQILMKWLPENKRV